MLERYQARIPRTMDEEIAHDTKMGGPSRIPLELWGECQASTGKARAIEELSIG